MITLCTTAKPFEGHEGVIQRNALESWTELDPSPEILLMGNEPGYQEVVEEFNLVHVPEVETSEKGVPYLDSMFDIGKERASHDVLGLLNADILLFQDFMEGVQRVEETLDDFHLVSELWDLDVTERIDLRFDAARIKDEARTNGRTHGGVAGMDYHIFRKDQYEELPSFIVGRPAWDSWFIYHARERDIPVIDGSPTIDVVHQAHGNAVHPEEWGGEWKGQETQANLDLVGDPRKLFTLNDATHVLTEDGVEPARTLPHLWRRIYTAPIVDSRFSFLQPLLEGALDLSRPLRKRLGVTLSNLTERTRR